MSKKYRGDTDSVSMSGCDNHMLNRYRALWRAVIMQAIVDSSSNSVRSRNMRYKAVAQDWLDERGLSFREVCDLGHLDPEYVSSKIQANSKESKGSYIRSKGALPVWMAVGSGSGSKTSV